MPYDVPRGGLWDGADYRPFSPPRRAVLYSGGKEFDVLVTRYRRGRWQICLPDGAESFTTKINGSRAIILRPGKTATVPMGMIEFVDPLPENEAAP